MDLDIVCGLLLIAMVILTIITIWAWSLVWLKILLTTGVIFIIFAMANSGS